MTPDYGLELTEVEEADGGQYTCQLDVFGHTQTALHNLTVLGENTRLKILLHFSHPGLGWVAGISSVQFIHNNKRAHERGL